MVDVGGNYRKILERIADAAVKARRDPRGVRLLAAAKSQSVEAIGAAIGAGVTLIGENYVQEAADKKNSIVDAVEWHMIGHLQRNKAKVAIELFDVIESLDNLALAQELDKEGGNRGKSIRALVEVNLGGEESKSGVGKDQLMPLLVEIAKLSHLRVEGLMTVPPFRDNLEEVRPYFRELRQLRDQLNELRLPNIQLTELSMGMTHDYTVAIEEGATIVRVGTALFGPRSK
ncbi:MAG: YggS family pyridoxal phosphate-dependent enzyme [Deltaproteobacteria bacterium]|nr:YggS family pyridoxal phosphate-dependent enzyme [Deltaproteobacteria bacterium]